MKNFKSLERQLHVMGRQSVEFLIKLLKENDKVASGNLLNSLDYEIVQNIEGVMLQIEAADYFKNVDEGRKAGSKPPPIAPIVSWLKNRKIRFRSSNGRFISNNAAAFIVAHSIAKKGIKPLNAKQKLIDNILSQKSKLIRYGVTEDLQDLIEKMFYEK